MASVHGNLIFDHIFAATNEIEFEELRKIFLQFECASHQKVKSENDEWEGLYISTRGRCYLEFLNDRKVNSMGLCLKAYGNGQDARNIVHDYPELPWKTFERAMDGKPWYTALSCDNYFDLQTPFNTWVMHYHPRSTESILPIRKVEIDRIREIHYSGNHNLVDRIRANSEWFNGENLFESNRISFNLKTFYADSFLIRIELDKVDAGFRFQKAIFTINEQFMPQEFTLEHFRFVKLASVSDRADFVLERLRD